MPEQTYPAIRDPRITVEKPVKEKPKIQDLTTIEKQGRPISASEIESFAKKTRKKKRPKASKEQTSIKRKKDSILIITEKPQAALKIASALADETPRKYSENRVPFYELTRDSKKIIVASAVGHLFNLNYKKGQTGWPIFEIEWIPSHQKKASFTKNYYNLLKKFTKRAKQIIIATDYDNEGEVIGWNVLRFIFKKEDAKRMKYSTLTKPELIKAYENPLPNLDWGQAYAGETRHEIDWLYGINLSRALMSAIKTTGSFKILSIGRVQGPALKIIVDREREISNFKSQPYWQVFADIDWNKKGLLKPTEDCNFKHPKDIFNREELKEFENIKEAQATTKTKEEHLQPPTPFDLTSLQRESYKLYKISPSSTLKIAQSLYLNGLISYPRTSSQKIPKEIEPQKILKKLSSKFPEVKYATKKVPTEGKKSDPAHPSIYPTGEMGQTKDEQENKLYKLIIKRFISCFCQDAITENKHIVLISDNNKKFTTSALQIKEKGWLKVYPAELKQGILPDINGKVNIDKINFQEKETQPPRRYTPASLITILEKKNLGTKATRSSIIDTLFNRGYLDGRSIQATPLGIKLIETLEKYSPIIIDENLTKDLEIKIEEIQFSKIEFKEKQEKIVKNVRTLITDISKEFKINETKIGMDLLEGTQALREIEKENNILMPCPICKKGNLAIKYSRKTKRQFVACDNYPECKTTYSLPPNSFIKKTGKISKDGLQILISLKKGKRPWEFTFDPHWKEKQEKKEK